MKVKCYDIVEMAVDAKSRELYYNYYPDPVLVNALRACCDCLDLLSEQVDGRGFAVQVEEDLTVSITLTCPCLYLEPDYILFRTLAGLSVRLAFEPTPEADLAVTFTFPGVWLDTDSIILDD